MAHTKRITEETESDCEITFEKVTKRRKTPISSDHLHRFLVHDRLRYLEEKHQKLEKMDAELQMHDREIRYLRNVLGNQ